MHLPLTSAEANYLNLLLAETETQLISEARRGDVPWDNRLTLVQSLQRKLLEASQKRGPE